LFRGIFGEESGEKNPGTMLKAGGIRCFFRQGGEEMKGTKDKGHCKKIGTNRSWSKEEKKKSGNQPKKGGTVAKRE